MLAPREPVYYSANGTGSTPYEAQRGSLLSWSCSFIWACDYEA
jgi:hypothetical protein